jgi:alkane 1-monooxygenase
VFVSPLLGLLALERLGWWVLSAPIFTWVMIPLLDRLVGLDKENHADGAWAPALRALPILFVPTYLVVLGLGLRRLAELPFGWEAVGLGWGVSVGGAIAIVAAHELMHRKGALEQRLAEVLMASVSYTHFCIEHVHGHHKRVATPEDPATSRLGESLYAFVPRSIVGGLRSAWAIESVRLARDGRRPWSPDNRMLRYLVGQIVILVGIGAWLGPVGVAWFLVQSALAVALLENINYLEHYGLQRERSEGGRYERVRPEHSWNASHAVSNSLLLSLARHSDHHAYVNRPYSELRHWEGAPQLPAGYASMTVLALFPPLWRRVMDPRVAALRAATAAPGFESASSAP